MPLKPLETFNGERLQVHAEMLNNLKPHPNGIECPKCGGECWDSCPSFTLTSSPPQKNIHCPQCGYIGYRIA